MPYLEINQSDFPDLSGKIAVVSGGSSGIGLAAVKILLSQNATVYILDLRPPKEEGWEERKNVHFLRCDVSSWTAVRSAVQEVPYVDMCFANAGIAGLDDHAFGEDRLDDRGQLIQPEFDTINVNVFGVLNLVKMCRYRMRQRGRGGSIVITASGVSYTAEKCLPIYTATKGFILGFLRAYRLSWIREGISLNAVAPCPTDTNVLPPGFLEKFLNTGVLVSDPHVVGLALVYSAVAKEKRQVEVDLRDGTRDARPDAKWNGRVIWILGQKYTELEEPYDDLRSQWLGEENDQGLRRQQLAVVPWWK